MLYVFAILKHGKSFFQIQTYFSSSSSWTIKKLLARGPETVTHQIGPPVHLISCLTTSQAAEANTFYGLLAVWFSKVYLVAIYGLVVESYCFMAAVPYRCCS